MVSDVHEVKRAKMAALLAPAAQAGKGGPVGLSFRMLGRFVPVGAGHAMVRAAALAARSHPIRCKEDDKKVRR